MLNLILWSLIGLETIIAVLCVCRHKRMLQMMNRNVNNDSYYCLGRLAREIYELACEDLKLGDSYLSIAIKDLGNITMGQTACDMRYKLVVGININPNQTLENFVNTVLHETRHYYQSIMTPELIFETDYISGVKEENFDAYYAQDIEIDARQYADIAAKKYRRRIVKMIKQYHKQNSKQIYIFSFFRYYFSFQSPKRHHYDKISSFVFISHNF